MKQARTLSSTTRWILFLACGGPFLGVPLDAAAQPVINFTSSQYAVVEGYTDVVIPLTISEIPPEQLSVYVYIDPVTATPGYDFVSGTTLVYFQPAGPDTGHAYVQIYGDEKPEVPETIRLASTTGASITRPAPRAWRP